jgi:acyl-CoA thioesterase
MKENFTDEVWAGIIGHTKPLGLKGIKILDVKPGFCKLEAIIDETNVNFYGFAHGGMLFTLCDNASGMATYAYGVYNVTLDSSISYLKSVKAGKINIVCANMHKGRKTAVNKVNIFNEVGDLCVTSTFTMYIKGEINK